MATRRPSRILVAALLAWVVFGAWALFRPKGDVPGVDPLVGHVVVFFFLSLATFGLVVRPLGAVKGMATGAVAIMVVAAFSEILQPIVTETRQAQVGDFAANGVGVAAALVVSLGLVAVLRKPLVREIVTAVLCVVGLAGSAALIAVGADRVRVELECGGRGFEPIASATGEPIVQIVGETAMLGNNESVPVGDPVLADDSADLRCSLMRSGSYSIVASVVPATTDVGGPMRIFASSTGTDFDEQNTHIGQEFDELSVRIDSEEGLQWESIPDVFTAGERVTVAMVVGNGEVNVFVDGEFRAAFDLDGESFSGWDANYPLLIGDEFTRNRTFQGEIESVLVFDRALDSGDAALAISGS